MRGRSGGRIVLSSLLLVLRLRYDAELTSMFDGGAGQFEVGKG